MPLSLKPFKNLPLHFVSNTEILLITEFYTCVHHSQVWHIVGTECLVKEMKRIKE